jgi:hypothetical protein
MRLTNILLKGRIPQNDKVPLQEIMQLKLRNKVSGKYDETNGKNLANLLKFFM